ncbi:MAG: hypothetical protein WC733_03715, partial [Methylophilus sp.]
MLFTRTQNSHPYFKVSYGLTLLVFVCLALLSHQAYALDAKEKLALTLGDNDTRIAALNAAIVKDDAELLPYLKHLQADEVMHYQDGLYIVSDENTTNALTGEVVELPDDAEEIINNNQMGSELDAAIAALNLLSADPATRLEAAKALQGTEANASRLSLIKKAESSATQTEVKSLLNMVRSSIELTSKDKAERIAAAEVLANSGSAEMKQMLMARLNEGGEQDAEVLAVIKNSLKKIDSNLVLYERLGQVFTGISLGSILLLAALGLAVTYGLMGVINMAHGEMMMIGAYATYIVQDLFLKYLPAHFGWYLLVAIPVAFIVTAIVGIIIERSVIRFLYSR